jgi:hypothetical protein
VSGQYFIQTRPEDNGAYLRDVVFVNKSLATESTERNKNVIQTGIVSFRVFPWVPWPFTRTRFQIKSHAGLMFEIPMLPRQSSEPLGRFTVLRPRTTYFSTGKQNPLSQAGQPGEKTA